MTADPPRIYTSFAAFERDERERLGLEALPAVQAEHAPLPVACIERAPSPVERIKRAPRSPALTPPAKQRARPSVAHTQVTPEALRAEGVLEVGCATGTSVLYVLTRVKLHLLHVTWIPDRRLDDYAVTLAMNWIEEYGMPSYEVSNNLGVKDETLRQALLAAGYERAVAVPPASKRRGNGGRGNRRGRFMRRALAPT